MKKIKKIVIILLIFLIIIELIDIPIVRAEDSNNIYTITYDANGGEYEDETTKNVITYDSNHMIVSGEYKQPEKYASGEKVGKIESIYWSIDKEGTIKADLNNISTDTTLYAQFTKIVWNFSYTGEEQIFTTPFVGTYQFECWGAQGGGKNGVYVGRKRWIHIRKD